MEQNDTVMDLMTKICQQEGISPGQMILIGKSWRYPMQENTTLEYCRVEDGDLIHLVLIVLSPHASTTRPARPSVLYGQKPAPAA